MYRQAGLHQSHQQLFMSDSSPQTEVKGAETTHDNNSLFTKLTKKDNF